MNPGMTQHRMSLNVSVLPKKIKKRYHKHLILIRLLSAQFHLLIAVIKIQIPMILGGHHSHDRMVFGFPTTCAISAYHHQCCEFEARSGEVYSIQYYVIKFVSDLRQVGGFLLVLLFPPPIKLTTTIYLKYC